MYILSNKKTPTEDQVCDIATVYEDMTVKEIYSIARETPKYFFQLLREAKEILYSKTDILEYPHSQYKKIQEEVELTYRLIPRRIKDVCQQVKYEKNLQNIHRCRQMQVRGRLGNSKMNNFRFS